jgi:cytochrome c
MSFLIGLVFLVAAAPAAAADPPPHLALRLDAPSAGLGTLVAGVDRDYSVTVTGAVTSTAEHTTLRVLDPTVVWPGHLLNGSSPLPQPLQVRADAGPYAQVPADVRTYDGGVRELPVTIDFKQPIAATDVLVAGDYGKTLTLELVAATP